jgi:hypothetical protein
MRHTCKNPPLHMLIRGVGLALWFFCGWRLAKWGMLGLTGSGPAALLAAGLALWPGLSLVSMMLAGACGTAGARDSGRQVLWSTTVAGLLWRRASHE